MECRDEVRLIRDRMEQMRKVLERADSRECPAGGVAVVLKTATETTYPTTAKSFYACDLIAVSGAESEGTIPSLTPGSSVVYAANCGTKIPPSGTILTAILQDGRFVFQYDGSE